MSRLIDELAWQESGLCRAPSATIHIDAYFPDLFDEDAACVVPSEIQQQCAMCPLKQQCIKWAIDHDEFGFWGGTSRYQRRLMQKVTKRVKCFSCGSDAVMENPLAVRPTEVCMSCGTSWPI